MSSTEIRGIGVDTTETEREQRAIDVIYRHYDARRAELTERMREPFRELQHELGQYRNEREAIWEMSGDRLNRLIAAEDELVFGRLDPADGAPRYIGRTGLRDDAANVVLLDWRAEQARAFYLATPIQPAGMIRRRHIRMRERTVTGVDDDILDRDILDRDILDRTGLVGEAALLVALGAERTGRMPAIVATIQAEQDAVVRAPAAGVHVVQGGPGTGKTAVALHRAAYLLYARRELLSRRVVLVIGPTDRFLEYVGDVLPGLGERSVLLKTVGSLFPGITATGAESAPAGAIKGRLAMADVIAAGVTDRERLPSEPWPIPYVDDDVAELTPAMVEAAQDRAEATNLPHNRARRVFVESVIDSLTAGVADRLGADPFGGANWLDPAEKAELRAEIAGSSAVNDALDELWPVLAPERFLADLLSDADLLEAAAPDLSPAERSALHRSPDAPLTPADIPLIDEAAVLLGIDEAEHDERAEREHAHRIALAQEVLDIAVGSQSTDLPDDEEAGISVFDLYDAQGLAERQQETDRRTPTQRAAADQEWTYGHVIVDEAQELSPMDWRMLLRRCPSRSMTVVGDTAQSSGPPGTWRDRLAPLLGTGFDLRELTVNYRTPAAAMAVAESIRAQIAPTQRSARSVRAVADKPWRRVVNDIATALPECVAGELEAVGHGTVAVLTAPDDIARIGATASDSDRVTVTTAAGAKGLEFDSVIVVEPTDIAASGLGDLYVALTRTTRRLGILDTGEVPAALETAALAPWPT
ncbi:MAG: HelD family protein [Mycobacteriales bacterium]